MHRYFITVAAALVTATSATPAIAQCSDGSEFIGRWDLTVAGPGGAEPSWLEVTRSGSCVLVGRFVGRTGSARPIGRIDILDGFMRFTIPRQWERGDADLQLEAQLEQNRLVGTLTLPNGQQQRFTAERAPVLLHADPIAWGEPIALFNGRDLAGWTAEPHGSESNWRVIDGVLANTASGANLMTTRHFDDFALHVEFRYPAGGNSGIYLRGRYEVQIEDTPRREWPGVLDLGGIYGFLVPNHAAALEPGQWHTFDITLVGRRVTVVLNGLTIISDQIIPGITGGALDSAEAEPGPILLQGDHTAVEFRTVRLTPALRPAGSLP